MARVAYLRCSTSGQTVDAQRQALAGRFDREFVDRAVSGAIPAASRTGFAAMLDYIREGDELHVSALDRIGRDALDVQATVRKLLALKVRLEVLGVGTIASGSGEIVIAVLAQMANIERMRIKERCDSGRAAARDALKLTGKTHRGKLSLGRPAAANATEVRDWRRMHGASIQQTAQRFSIAASTVKRYCASA